MKKALRKRNDENEEGTGGPCTGAPTGEDGGAQRDGGGGGEPDPPTECSELVLSPTGHAETLREYLSPGGEAVSAGFEKMTNAFATRVS